jgi:ribosomal subunit interface protein
MKTNVTFRHFNTQHPLLQTAAQETATHFTKFLENISSTDVEFINDTDKIVECTVVVNKEVMKSSGKSDDFHKSLHIASDKIIRQLNKYKTKHYENPKISPSKI